jgi:hypothetical protein
MQSLIAPHRRRLSRISPGLRAEVLRVLRLPPLTDNLVDVLDGVGMGQADLVLALLRATSNTREARTVVGVLIGHPIVVCPPCLRLAHQRLPQRKYRDGERRVTWVGENKFPPTSKFHERFRMLRPGMLVSEYRARGGQHRDLRFALARGLIRMEKAA